MGADTLRVLPPLPNSSGAKSKQYKQKRQQLELLQTRFDEQSCQWISLNVYNIYIAIATDTQNKHNQHPKVKPCLITRGGFGPMGV